MQESSSTKQINRDIDELAKRWVELLLTHVIGTEDLELGNNKKVCKDRVVSKRKALQPRK